MALIIESDEERQIIDYLIQNNHVSFFRMFDNFYKMGKLFPAPTIYNDRHIGYYFIQKEEDGQNVDKFRKILIAVKRLIESLKEENLINVHDTMTDLPCEIFVHELVPPYSQFDTGFSNLIAECRRLEIITSKKLEKFKEYGYRSEKKESKTFKYWVSILALIVAIIAVTVAIRNCGFTKGNYDMNKDRENRELRLDTTSKDSLKTK